MKQTEKTMLKEVLSQLRKNKIVTEEVKAEIENRYEELDESNSARFERMSDELQKIEEVDDIFEQLNDELVNLINGDF